MEGWAIDVGTAHTTRSRGFWIDRTNEVKIKSSSTLRIAGWNLDCKLRNLKGLLKCIAKTAMVLRGFRWGSKNQEPQISVLRVSSGPKLDAQTCAYRHSDAKQPIRTMGSFFLCAARSTRGTWIFYETLLPCDLERRVHRRIFVWLGGLQAVHRRTTQSNLEAYPSQDQTTSQGGV